MKRIGRFLPSLLATRHCRAGIAVAACSLILHGDGRSFANEKADSTPRLEVKAWDAKLLPPPFLESDDPRTFRGFPLDSLPDAGRPKLQASFAADLPTIDGRVADWPVVRWHDLRGASTRVRGTLNSAGDAALDFALLWTTQGLVLGARLQDDSLTTGSVDPRRIESVLLYVGTSSTVAQRYWRGGERALRIWADGRLEAWTRMHNRRVVLFDPQALGARGAATVQRGTGPSGKVEFELLVPWEMLFPALPHEAAGLLVNVLVEDVDAHSEKLLAWVTRPGTVERKSALVSGWARLLYGDGPPDGTWLAAIGSRHLEPGVPCEWSLLRWGQSKAPTALEVGEHGKKVLRVELTQTPALVRYHAALEARTPWPSDRRVELDLGVPGAPVWRHEVLHLAPTAASLVRGADEIDDKSAPERVFPRAADVAARLQKVGEKMQMLGEWREVRHTERGILASRASAWAAFENQLIEAHVLRDLTQPPRDRAAHERLLAALWPQRNARGFPVGVPFLRGHRAVSDASVQPYAVHLSRAAAASSKPVPLLVVLHEVDDDEMAPFDPALLAAVDSRGWVAISPYARGNLGFQLAGERDVVDILQQSLQDLPVDGKRVYVTGFGMGASGAWLLSVRHAHLFAAAAIVSGYGDMDQPGLFQALSYAPEELFYYETMNPARLLRPEVRTVYRIVHADQDPVISVVHARLMAAHLVEYGLVHELEVVPTAEPGRVLFARELNKNLDFMAAHTSETPSAPEPAWFGGTGGPIATVFSRAPFAVVHGTRALTVPPVIAGTDSTAQRAVTGAEADARAAEHFALEWAALFAGKARVVADNRVDATLQSTTNLVLVGDPRTNRVLEAVASQLPVRYDGDTFTVDGKSWSFRDAGILFAVGHPTADGRTLVIASGMVDRIGGFARSPLKLGADYVVVNDQRQMLAIGHFRGLGATRSVGPPGDSR